MTKPASRQIKSSNFGDDTMAIKVIPRPNSQLTFQWNPDDAERGGKRFSLQLPTSYHTDISHSIATWRNFSSFVFATYMDLALPVTFCWLFEQNFLLAVAANFFFKLQIRTAAITLLPSVKISKHVSLLILCRKQSYFSKGTRYVSLFSESFSCLERSNKLLQGRIKGISGGQTINEAKLLGINHKINRCLQTSFWCKRRMFTF